MKKQLIFLYALLLVFLAVICYACFSLITMETEPPVPTEYASYVEYQESVETEAADDRIYLDFDRDALLSVNKAFDSWLMIPDTEISYPVVTTTDNFYYLDYSFEKNASAFGCLYYDIASVPGSENRVIHGHNMGVNRTEMFSTLVNYQEQEFAQEHKLAYLASDSEVPADVYEVFAVVNHNLEYSFDFNYSIPDFETEEEKQSFVSYLQERSVYETEFVPEGNLLILSTCNRQFGSNNRLLICLGQTEPQVGNPE